MTRDNAYDRRTTVVTVTDPHPVPGRYGVTIRDGGLDVSVIARSATSVDFCIIGVDGTETRYRLMSSNAGI